MDGNRNIPAELELLPAALQRLLEEELAAGNEIAEIGHSFPAPPIGIYCKLKHPVRSHVRVSTTEIRYVPRNSSLYSGEFSDQDRRYFVLEPPLPPPPEPNMDEIRALHNRSTTLSPQDTPNSRVDPDALQGQTMRQKAADSTAVARFQQSMHLNYEKWHDGIGYDLEAIAEAEPQERQEIEGILLRHGVVGWRDVEALTALGTPRALTTVTAAINHDSAEVRASVIQHAPQLITDQMRDAALIRGIEEADIFEGLSLCLSMVQRHPSPALRTALLRNALRRHGSPAGHLAAMAAHLHGKAKSPFDWELRPLFLRFNEPDDARRFLAFKDLCALIGVDPQDYL